MDPFLYILLVWPFVGINVYFTVIVLTELLAPKFKWYFLITYLIIGPFYHLCLYLNPEGNKNVAKIKIEDKSLLEAEQMILDTIKKNLKNLNR